VNEKARWKRFVEARRTELHDDYPCAAPTYRRLCPKHGVRVGPVIRICKPCRDELYERLAGEYSKGDTTMTTEAETIETAGELELYEPPGLPATLCGNDPRLAVERMSDLARVLVDIVRNQKLSVEIGGREFLTAEAWSALGALVGVTPVVCWVKPNETGDGYVARVEARTLDGRVVGAAESECSRAEKWWKTREPFQLRSMAQTSGISRSLRATLAVIPVLAGYEPGSSEEMADVVVEPEPDRGKSKIPDEARPTSSQVEELNATLTKLRELAPNTDWPAVAREAAGVPSFDYVTRSMAERVLETLRAHLAELEYPSAEGGEAA
jgi:hypothetical protein